MNQLVINLLLKLRRKYPDNKGIIKLLGESWESKEKLAEKTGVLEHKAEELFNRLSIDDREAVFLKLLEFLYPQSIVNKHPKQRVWLCKLGDDKFVYEVESNTVVMPFPNEEPRKFPAGIFVENMPKLDEFLKYLNTYSMRNRKRFNF